MTTMILASNSPRRKEILMQTGLTFQVLTANQEEHSPYKEPENFVKDLARQKVKAVESLINQKGDSLKREKKLPKIWDLAENKIIIGADTIVVMENQILGKPKDEKEAFFMLSSLQGKSHQVLTGVFVVILEKESKKEFCFAELTKVQICAMEEEEIYHYIATKEPMDKAGSYAIQGKFGRYIEGICGDYYNVVGFPLNRFYKEMKKNGFGFLFK